MKYELRFFFDLGSGVCLWSNNEASRKQFDYPIDHWELPISENTKRWLDYLITWYDTSLNWDSPPEISTSWSDQENERFRKAVASGFNKLTNELPATEYKVQNEFNT